MKIIVDRDLCQGHGVCESEASGVFKVAKGASSVTVLDESPDESKRAEIELAVRYCPTSALSIKEG